jgi:hypothetical protein
MNADDYNYQRFLDPTKSKPKVPGVRKPPAFNLGGLLGGRPNEYNIDPAKDAAHKALDGTQTTTDQGIMNQFNPLRMLLLRRGSPYAR